MIPELDRRSVASGATVGVAVGAVAAVTIRLVDVVHDVSTRSNLLLVFAGIVLAIPIAQGHNERLLALIPYLIFALLMFGSSGIFGALVVTSQRERSRARRRRRPPAHRAR